MKILLTIMLIFILTACINSETATIKISQTDTTKVTEIINDPVSIDTIETAKSTQTNPSVLVLPPYDVIANEGISPDIQKYLEKIISSDTSLKLIRFPYRQLMNVSYQNVFDKKFCKPITEKIETDIIVMSKIDQSKGTGNMTNDKWDLKIKIYHTKTGIQKTSNLTAYNMTITELENSIKSKREILFIDIKK